MNHKLFLLLILILSSICLFSCASDDNDIFTSLTDNNSDYFQPSSEFIGYIDAKCTDSEENSDENYTYIELPFVLLDSIEFNSRFNFIDTTLTTTYANGPYPDFSYTVTPDNLGNYIVEFKCRKMKVYYTTPYLPSFPSDYREYHSSYLYTNEEIIDGSAAYVEDNILTVYYAIRLTQVQIRYTGFKVRNDKGIFSLVAIFGM